jgi:hypothetical protein
MKQNVIYKTIWIGGRYPATPPQYVSTKTRKINAVLECMTAPRTSHEVMAATGISQSSVLAILLMLTETGELKRTVIPAVRNNSITYIYERAT